MSGDGHGQIGVHGTSTTRVPAGGGSLLATSVPANGTFRLPFPTVPIPPPMPYEFGSSSSGFGGHRNNHKHVECPEFDGENPTGWRLRCDAYFHVCGIDPQV